MFGLIRRISHSVIPRPDRPWEDDPTSNAPNTRRKRRISTTEYEDAGHEEQTRKKKLRGEDTENLESDNAPSSPAIAAADASNQTNEDTKVGVDSTGEPEPTIHREGSLEVKVVTKGVNEVELEDKQTGPDDTTTVVNATTTTTPSDEVPAHPSENTVDPSASSATEETSIAVNPETIPLPEEKAGELDEDIRSSSSPVPESSAHTREDSAATAVEPSSELAEPEASKVNDNEAPTAEYGVSSRPETPRQTRASRSSGNSGSARKLRSKSPKKVSARA
ncbi:hypothetical protein D9756_008737 [Leucocoprinus leucothites]|uniref:Uncharacterized protein n=1 Tax=Leucocoprinus leucothites TaxID=201217 RepID=A0A8H5D1Z1_9AGAR|nr:hypothetical protein D9756_008737 [Leucoagaricus leucothites]